MAGELWRGRRTASPTYDGPRDGWYRRGLRSNGSEFTVATIAVYHLHDIVHHAWDVRHSLADPLTTLHTSG